MSALDPPDLHPRPRVFRPARPAARGGQGRRAPATSARGSAGAAATSWVSSPTSSTRWPRTSRSTSAGSRSWSTATRSPSCPTTAASRRRSPAELDRARARGRPFAVVLLDIDDFKRVNEARGHPYGDELLGRAAGGLVAAMRDVGVVARVGGDEFGLVLPDADGQRAFALAEAARTAVEVSAPVTRHAALLGRDRLLPRRRQERRRAAAARRRRAAVGQGERSRAGAPLRPRARLRRHRGAARGLRLPDRAAGGACDRSSSRSSRWPAASRSATRRWRASRASPACRRRGGSRRRTASGSGPRSRPSPCAPRWRPTTARRARSCRST